MSDVEQADDDIENPEPEADFQATEDLRSDSDYESNIDHEQAAFGGGHVEEELVLRNYDGEVECNNLEIDNSLAEGDQDTHGEDESNQAENSEEVENSLAEGDQSLHIQCNQNTNNNTAPQQNFLAEGDQHSGIRVLDNHVQSLVDTGEGAQSIDHDIMNGHDDLAAEDEQFSIGNEVNFAGAEWSLEPEANSHNCVASSERDCAVGAFSPEAVESDQSGHFIGTISTERTESSSQLDDDSDCTESVAGPSGGDDSGTSDVSGCTMDQVIAEGAAYSLNRERLVHDSGQNREPLLVPEDETILQTEKETTEADQEIHSDLRNADRAYSDVHVANIDSSEGSVRNIQSSLNHNDLDAAGPSNVGQVPEDEIRLKAPSEPVSLVTTDSYEPECDQTALEENECHYSDSSPQMLNSEGDEAFQSSNKDKSESSECKDMIDSSDSKLSEISNNNSLSPARENIENQGAETDIKSNGTGTHTSSVNQNDYCDNESYTAKPKSVSTVQELSLTSDKGAIPKQRNSHQSSVESSPVKLNNLPKQSKHTTSTSGSGGTSGETSNSTHMLQAESESLKNTDIEDAEDALLSELDATLQVASASTPRNSSVVQTNNSIMVDDLTDHSDNSCEQCKQNNLPCSLTLSKGDHSNIPEVKEMQRQLHQAKNLLLERECQISRLKDDLEEKEENNNTLVLKNESFSKELECLKAQNSDDLYIPQIKELEYTIAQQQNEVSSWKDKLASHDAAAKRAIATLQNEMKIRLEQVTKTCQEATKEKDSMVVKYAQAEHKNLEFQKQAERAESKLKEMEKERDAFLLKMRAVKEQRTRLGTELEARNAELHNVNKELDKHRELVSSADVRVKWAQNKLKAELEAHKETKIQLEKTSVKLKEAKEETQQIRSDCQAIIKTYQESEEVKSNSLDKELKQKESELLVNQQEKTNWELAHVKTQRELEHVKGDLRDSKSHCANLTEKLSSLEEDLSQSNTTVEKYGEIIQKQKKEIHDFRERIETLVQYRTDFTRSQELIKNLDSEISELKISNKDLIAEMEACKKREMDKLELTEKLTNKNVELRSENTTMGNKVLALTGELQSIKMEYQGTDVRIKDLTDSLDKEQKLRREETQTLNTKLAGKCKAVEDLTRKLDEEKDEIKTLKRKHTNNIRDLTRQLQLVRRKLETHEASTVNGDKDTVSMGSRTSSNGSLNINEQSSTQVAQPNNTAGPTSNSLHNHTITEQEYPVITEQVEVDKQVLIERIVKLQRALARKNEKIEFMDDHISQLVDEIQKKNKIIQSYILKEDSGTMTSEYSDRTKAEISRKHSIMGSVYSSHSNDGTMSLELSLEINRKLQAVLEDTLLKNMTLKGSIDTLGQEIARLSQENRQLQLKLQGLSKSRGKGNPAVR